MDAVGVVDVAGGVVPVEEGEVPVAEAEGERSRLHCVGFLSCNLYLISMLLGTHAGLLRDVVRFRERAGGSRPLRVRGARTFG